MAISQGPSLVAGSAVSCGIVPGLALVTDIDTSASNEDLSEITIATIVVVVVAIVIVVVLFSGFFFFSLDFSFHFGFNLCWRVLVVVGATAHSAFTIGKSPSIIAGSAVSIGVVPGLTLVIHSHTGVIDHNISEETLGALSLSVVLGTIGHCCEMGQFVAVVAMVSQTTKSTGS